MNEQKDVLSLSLLISPYRWKTRSWMYVHQNPSGFFRGPRTLVTIWYLQIQLQLNPAMSNSVISNSPLSRTELDFPWICPCFFSPLLWVTSNSVISNTPLSRTVSRSPELKSTPTISNFLLRSEETLVNISQEVQSRHLLTRCTESWEMYWRVHGNESKVRLTGLAAANAEGDKLPVFDNFGDQTITPEIWRQPRYLEPPLSRTIFQYPWEFEIAGFYCSRLSAMSHSNCPLDFSK